ncbi:alanine racemase [Heliobacillus mobilis]|uniref:Alanine racemase n=1 Tax=Heliobacterium mobile TaxID=28064 RepID=A0A6I3SKY0_HELMO|nr:alanine racemase [Heliobacterium mobile]MTV49550.1 alanine racemase [Heliobacterium mobile]
MDQLHLPEILTPRSRLDEATGGLGCWVQVDLDALAHNARAIRKTLGHELIIYGVVKANAYGCGAVESARCLMENGVDRLAVTHVSEGIQLRQNGIKAPILVMGPAFPEEIAALIHHKLTPAVATVELAQRIADEAGRSGKSSYPIHVKIETGLGRTGVFAAAAPELAAAIASRPELQLEGAFTHLATAATGDRRFVHDQVARFQAAVAAMESGIGSPIPIKHAANSAAALAFPQYRFDAVRLGTVLYGQPPLSAGERLDLREVWGLKARIAHVSLLPADHGVGYGRAFITRRPTKVAVLPVGYVDGFQLEPASVPTGLWDLTKVLIKTAAAYFGVGPSSRFIRIGKAKAPVLGKVAMQFTMVDVTAIPDVQPGHIAEVPARRTVVALNVPRVYISADEQERLNQEVSLAN